MDPHIAELFKNAQSDDIVTKLVAWGRLEKVGLATQYVVGQRFVHLSLNEEGQRLRAEYDAAQVRA